MCLEMLKSQLSFSISFLPYVGLLSIKDDNQEPISPDTYRVGWEDPEPEPVLNL